MATVIKQTEGIVESYAAIAMPKGGTVSRDALWQRIEPYIAIRFGERTIEWIVEGPGEWHPPLKPATISTIEVWSHRANEYETATLDPSPLGGYYLHHSGPYRFTGTVGDDSVIPDSIRLALFRLGAYMNAKQGAKPGSSSESVALGGDLTDSFRRDPAWMAKALQNSGAADLLRQWRNV